MALSKDYEGPTGGKNRPWFDAPSMIKIQVIFTEENGS